MSNLTKEKNKRFFSIRTKLLCIYGGIMLCLVIIVATVMPNIFRQYFIRAKLSDLEKTRNTVSAVLQEADFRVDPDAAQMIRIAAESANVNVWIAIPSGEGKADIYVFGSGEEADKEIDFSSFTLEEKARVRAVFEGGTLSNTLNAFPSAYASSMISIGFPQEYVEASIFSAGPIVSEIKVQKTGAMFLNISMDEIAVTARQMQTIVLVVVLLIALTGMLLAVLMTNNVLTPVQKIKTAAEGITKGDFSQEVEYQSNDEIGQLVDSFNIMSRELKEVDTLQSDFIANISHDFRSPLTSIKGYVEAMLDGTIPADMHEKYLQIVLDEANRLTKMTNNVLDLTKMENGQIELNRTNFELNEMIIGLALTLEQRVTEKKIQMNFQFLQEKLYVYADYDLMQRVMYNLLDNALKFTDEGDSITVETSIVGKKAYIVVSDNGDGIDEEALPHVFERFNKGDKSRGKNKMGTGLGLAIVKQIMLNHKEDIKVYSKPGEGTKFAFTLPLAKNVFTEKK